MRTSIYIVKNKYQGVHGYFSTWDKANDFIVGKMDNSYGSCWAWHCWEIKKVFLDEVEKRMVQNEKVSDLV